MKTKTFRSTMMCFPFWLLLGAGSLLAEFTTPTPGTESAPAQKTDSKEGETRTWKEVSPNAGTVLICTCTMDPRFGTCVPGTLSCFR